MSKGSKTHTAKAPHTAPISYDQLVNEVCKLDQAQIQELCRQWIKANLELDLPNQQTTGYDQWLAFFRTIPPARLLVISKAGLLGAEAEAALRRWLDIQQTPARIDKIYQGGLRDLADTSQSITELAKTNDRLGILYALRDRIAAQLERGTGARDTASLSREMGGILDQIAEVERRQGPKENTELAKILNKKRTRDKGVRNVSYRAKSIKELEK